MTGIVKMDSAYLGKSLMAISVTEPIAKRMPTELENSIVPCNELRMSRLMISVWIQNQPISNGSTRNLQLLNSVINSIVKTRFNFLSV
jgi:hypothetical protein